MTIIEKSIIISSDLLQREVTCTWLMPDEQEIDGPLNLLLLNDGQELENLELRGTLEQLYGNNRLKPTLVVAIHAAEDRIQEYGVAGNPDFKGRGSRADIYTAFIKTELLPMIEAETGVNSFETTAFAGFSLGGLSAFDIAWNNGDVFDKVGVFSGSFWWRRKDLGNGYTDADRIMHSVIKNTGDKPSLKFWLQTGTHDETSDRNKNGIIDAIDDTIDLIKELEDKGYKRPEDIQYIEVVGGSHDTATWAKAMPKFLVWAFGR
ncbi:alpha/beta hydrolase [Mucilaginibacter sp. SP1R1]|uniref:alpha/beta hydrolase n=1 Tax=Mucilaginibacter sp. SP1R1 TaxID=2723091 RepID=UPI0017ECF315|nr:alpha/beta hydrolase-fold protein [Mucilaginibacter sp. SP1R1]MBB6151313.1 enterochelin esterase-like enzyme [Mucilaginibacter sp. SP1R1]